MIGRLAQQCVALVSSADVARRRAASWARQGSLEPPVPAPPLDSAPRLRFIAVGRQGYGNGDTEQIAQSMEETARETATHGVLYLGDNFYPKGVASVTDGQWRYKFERLYSGRHLRGMPFFAVVGNHDYEGDARAQTQYAQQKCGTARWHMDSLYYHRDFGRANDRVLARVVFLDTVALNKDPRAQLDFIRESFTAPGDPVWRIIVGHFGCRSVTNEPYTRRLTMSHLLPALRLLNVDLYLSANDRFQQILDREGEPLHVSTNGGGSKCERGVRAENPQTDFAASEPGFAVVEIQSNSLFVELRDVSGTVAYRRNRAR